MNLRLLFTGLLISISTTFLLAQSGTYIVPQALQYVDYKLDAAQKRLLASDGKADDELHGSSNADINLLLTYAATAKIDALQKGIELDTVFTNNQKITYIRGLTELVENFLSAYYARQLRLVQFPDVLKTWEECFILDRNQQSISDVVFQHQSSVGSVAIKGISFAENSGLSAAKNNLIIKILRERPDKLMQTLSYYPDMPFADSLLAVAVKTKPEELYNYAQATNTRLGQRILHNTNPAIKQICELANDKSGRLYFPFLDNLLKGKMTISEVKKGDGQPRYLLQLVGKN